MSNHNLFIFAAMLQIPFIRQNKQDVLKRLAKKNFDGKEAIDKILQLDDNRKALLFQKEEAQAQINLYQNRLLSVGRRKTES